MLKKLIYSFTPPLILLAIMWLVKWYEIHNGIDLGIYGVLPRHSEGLRGIFLSPFLHGSIDHLWSNTLPFIILMAALIFFYEEVWIPSFLMIYFLSGIGLWIGGRENYHIGASGIVYGLTGFLFASGLIRRTVPSMSLSMLVIFLYGGTIWGVFPLFKDVSWEAHLFGLLSGCIVAFVFSESGPKKNLYQWEKDEVEELMSLHTSESEGESEVGSGQLARGNEKENESVAAPFRDGVSADEQGNEVGSWQLARGNEKENKGTAATASHGLGVSADEQGNEVGSGQLARGNEKENESAAAPFRDGVSADEQGNEVGSGQLSRGNEKENESPDSPLEVPIAIGSRALQSPIINYIYTENKNPLP